MTVRHFERKYDHRDSAILPASRIVVAFQRAWDGVTPYAIATVVRTSGLTAAKPGARAIVTADGGLVGFIGGGCVRKAVIAGGRAAIAARTPRLITVVPEERLAARGTPWGEDVYASFCPSKGEMEVFVEPVLPQPMLIVFGAGDLASCLLDLCDMAGLTPVLCTAEDGVLPAGVRQVRPGDLAALPGLAEATIVVATQGTGDRAALTAALATPCPTVLFVASRVKAARVRTALIEAGIDAAACDRITAPAGLDIGAQTPGGIAISIAADIIARRRASLGHGPPP